MDINTVQIDSPFPGISIYRNTLPAGLDLVNRIEKVIEDNKDKNPWFKWSPALVGDGHEMKDYRDCVDFKVRKRDFVDRNGVGDTDLKGIYMDIDDRLQVCLQHYCANYGLDMQFQEAVNFVRYGSGQHFSAHPDSGATYVCAVSTVMYLNDSYTGGGLFFTHLGIHYTPKEGDIVIFPSNWLFTHAALPVEDGVKYSAVTMFDYTDRYHTDDWYKKQYNTTTEAKPASITMV